MSNEKVFSDAEKCLKAKKVSLYWLLGTIYTGFIGFELGQVQAIADINYTLHEMLYLPINLAFFLVPIELIVYIYFVFKCKAFSNELKSKNKKILKTILIILSLIFIFFVYGYQMNENSTSGIFEVETKIREGNYYYINLGDRKIRCTQNEFNLISTDQKYLITYTWNNYSPNKGKLINIQTITK